MYQKTDKVTIFSHAPHLENIIPSPACSQVEYHLSEDKTMLFHKATVIFLKCSAGGKLETSLLADEICCRSGVSLESYGVDWSPGRYIFGCWLVHIS